jgi:5-formyltetrahydrofolate cyclo-ligase
VDDFDPALLSELATRAKQQIRSRMRALRNAHPESVLASWSAAVLQRVAEHSAFSSCRSVGLFWPLLERREVDVRGLDELARNAGKTVFYPFMQPEGERIVTGFRRVDAANLLAERGQRFLEPPPEAPIAARGEIELIIVPALAVSAHGDRIGYGAGFYDATLPDFCPPARSLVVAYDFQLLAELPQTKNDVRCNVVVTEKRVFDAS